MGVVTAKSVFQSEGSSEEVVMNLSNSSTPNSKRKQKKRTGRISNSNIVAKRELSSTKRIEEAENEGNIIVIKTWGAMTIAQFGAGAHFEEPSN